MAIKFQALKSEVKSKVSQLRKANFFHIFGSNVFSLFLSFVVSIVVVRQLDKTLYGLYSSAYNIYGYFALFIGIGLINGLMQYCSEQRESKQKKEIYAFSLRAGSFASCLICICVILAGFIGIDNKQQVNKFLLMLCGVPILSFIASFFSTHARIKRNNKLFAYVNIFGAIVHFLVALIATKYLSVYGYIVSLYVQQIATIVAYLIYFSVRKEEKEELFNRSNNYKLVKSLKIEILKYSILCCITNLTSNLLALLDITCLNAILDAPTIIASYKIALAIPNALSFIPSSFLIFVYPYLAESNNNLPRLKKLIKNSVVFLTIVNAIVCAILFIFASSIIHLLWGNRYSDAVPVFRVLVVNYFITGSFRRIYGNVLVVIKKVKINLLTTIIAGLVNIGLNIVLISNFASVGAAYATLISTIITAIITIIYYYVWDYKQSTKEMDKSTVLQKEKEIMKKRNSRGLILLTGYRQVYQLQALFETFNYSTYILDRKQFIGLKGKFSLARKIIKADYLYFCSGDGGISIDSKIVKLARLFRTKVIVHWIGTDVYKLVNGKKNLSKKNIQMFTNITVSSLLQEELKSVGIEAPIIPIVPLKINPALDPLVDKHSVLVYLPTGKEIFYGVDILEKLAKAHPTINFHIVANEGYEGLEGENVIYHGNLNAEQMEELYKEVSILIRLPQHDGLSMMVIEALAKGKQVLYKYEHPYVTTPEGSSFKDVNKAFTSLISSTPTVNYAGSKYIEQHYNGEAIMNLYWEKNILGR